MRFQFPIIRPASKPGLCVRCPHRLPPFSSALVALLLLAPCALVAGQNGPTMGQIRVTGNHRFTAKQIIAASGLRPGTPASQQVLDHAAQRLSQTGAFSDLVYQYRSRGGTWDAELHVTEAAGFVPCIFDNFIWFSDAQLKAAVARDVPLFDGSLPETQGMQQEVTAALDRWLHAHQIPATTVVRPLVNFYTHKMIGILLRVSGMPMPVKDVQVAGGPLDAAAIRELAPGILVSDYSRHSAQVWTDTTLTEAFQDLGYLQPRFSEPSVATIDPAGKDPSQGVILRFTATPGLRYTWAGVTWTGNQTVTSEELTKLLQLSPGEVARRDRAVASWDAVQHAFGRQGYLTAGVNPVPNYDDRAATVHYDVQITRGPQFTMGDLVVDDPSEKVVQMVSAAWKLKPGDVYNVDLEKESLTEVGIAQAHAGRADKKLVFHRSLDSDTRTVSVLVKFE